VLKHATNHTQPRCKTLEPNPANEEKSENIFNFNHSNRICDFRIY